MENLKEFKKSKEEIENIKNDKKTSYRDKGRKMAKVVIVNFDEKENRILLSEFAKKIGMKIEIGDLSNLSKDENHSGEVWGSFDPKSKTITISNKIKTLRSQRFTIAHEIAHIFIDSEINEDGKISFNKDKYYRDFNNYEEVLYNDFAANLLVQVAAINPEKFLDMLKTANHIIFAQAYQVPIPTIGILAERLEKIKSNEKLEF